LARASPMPRGRLIIRRIMFLVAVVVFVLGIYLKIARRERRVRRERRRRAVRYEIIQAATDGDVPRILALLDEGADVNTVVGGRSPVLPLMHDAFAGNIDAP